MDYLKSTLPCLRLVTIVKYTSRGHSGIRIVSAGRKPINFVKINDWVKIKLFNILIQKSKSNLNIYICLVFSEVKNDV